jgi:hypothetical protein
MVLASAAPKAHHSGHWSGALCKISVQVDAQDLPPIVLIILFMPLRSCQPVRCQPLGLPPHIFMALLRVGGFDLAYGARRAVDHRFASLHCPEALRHA